MNKEQCFHLGHISKPRGFKGEMVFFLDVDIPEEYEGLKSVLVEMNGRLTPFFLEKFDIRDKGYVHVKIEDINSEAEANRLRKCQLYLPLEMLPKLKEGQFYYHEIVGYQVKDAVKGDIGKVKEVIEHLQNPVISIEFEDKEILLPLNEEVIKRVDKNNHIMEVEAPEGLIDLYLED